MNRKSLSWNVKQVCTMIDKGTITFDNPVQRPSRQWKKEDQSLLIDSILRMFVPDIYAVQVTKEIEGKMVNTYDIIDGKQRLTTINSFRKDEWALTQLDPVTLESTGETYDISGKKFSELPEEVQQEILGYTLTFKVIEIEDDEDEEAIVDAIFYRLNNGKPMSRGHLAFVSAHKDVQKYVHDKINNHSLFTITAHYPASSIKNSDRELTILQSILLAGGYEYKSFANKDIEEVFKDKEIETDVFNKVTAAFDMIVNAFPDYNKFVTKTSIPPMVALCINNNFDGKVISFLQNYAETTEKGDAYRRYCGASGTKKSMVEGRIKGLQILYEQYQD